LEKKFLFIYLVSFSQNPLKYVLNSALNLVSTALKFYAIMLEYIKTILEKVSFDRKLFEKELRKSIKLLVGEEVAQLRAWCYEKFSGIYRTILNQVFARA